MTGSLAARTLAAVVAALSAVVGTSGLASAQELPPGFTDGQPVGAAPITAPDAEQDPDEASAEAAAAIERYFGEGAYAAIRGAVTATSRSCSITDDGLTALVLAPVFKESSAATTPSTAPSPMTLSRYDEWSGTFGTGNNQDANYGLYAFRNPYTAYLRAYWHPGIGIWQYDSAGLGAPLTTVEAMNVGVVSADVARIMASGYCDPSSAVVGHGPPFTDQERRYSAWRDWGYPCTLCQGFFDEMIGTDPNFANLNMVGGISALGGTVQRTCLLQGVAGTLPCWYVEARVGVIEGATAWATLSPDGGSGPTVAPAPLSHPFYVVDRGATEERHWMTVDTGYSIDIRASRTIGNNARPRSNQVGSGLTWTSGSTLCDITAGRGACTPVPPAGVSSDPIAASSGYRPVSLDADGDGRGDVLWYRPGSGSDALWLGTGGGNFQSNPVGVNTSYDDVLTGDIDGDGDDDVLWYVRSSGVSYLWRSDGDATFTTIPLGPGAGRRPLLLDTDGNGDVEIFWYGPGSVVDEHWNWSGSTFVRSSRSVSGTYTPIVGDVDCNGRDDILWYAPGSAADYLWRHAINGSIVSDPHPVSGDYEALVGDLDGDNCDDVVWYAAGTAGDHVWFGAPGAAFQSTSISVGGTYAPFVADLLGTGRDTVVWYAPGFSQDTQFVWSSERIRSSTPMVLPGQHSAVVGGYSVGGDDGVVWYEPDLATDVVWFR